MVTLDLHKVVTWWFGFVSGQQQKSLSLKLLKVIFKLFYLKSEFVFLLFDNGAVTVG